MDERDIRNLIEEIEYVKEAFDRQISRLNNILTGLYQTESEMHSENKEGE